MCFSSAWILARWLAGFMACWPVGWLTVVAGLMSGWGSVLPAWLAGWLVGWPADWLAGLLTCWLVGYGISIRNSLWVSRSSPLYFLQLLLTENSENQRGSAGSLAVAPAKAQNGLNKYFFNFNQQFEARAVHG